jgi:hypothetical protein
MHFAKRVDPSTNLVYRNRLLASSMISEGQ